MTGSGERLLDQLPFGLLTLDGSARIVRATDSAAALLSSTRPELEGRNVFDVLPAFDSSELVRRELALSLGRAGYRRRARFDALEICFRAFPARDGLAGVAVLEEPAVPGSLDALVADLELARSIVAEARHEIANALMGLMGQVEMLETKETISDGARRRVASLAADVAKIRTQIDRLRTLDRR